MVLYSFACQKSFVKNITATIKTAERTFLFTTLIFEKKRAPISEVRKTTIERNLQGNSPGKQAETASDSRHTGAKSRRRIPASYARSLAQA